MAFFKEGRDYVDGAQYNISSRHWLELSPYFNLSVAPRIQFEFPHNKPLDQDQFFVDELQATAQFKNVRLSVGRAPLVLGQSSYGGFILSTNARAVDQIILSNDHPFRFPWIFKYLGDQKLVAYFGTLGPEYSFKNTLLSGYKWTLKPLNNWEMGLSNVMTIGGEGAPSFGALDFIGDFAGFSGTSNSVSNRILGFDTRVGIPKLNGLEIYAEAFWDDKTFKSLKRTLIDTSEYKLGFYLPTLTSNGRLSGRLELKYVSELFYRHSQFQSGYTLNNEILGDPLGPDGKSVDVNFDYAWNNKAQSQLKLTYITSDSNTYSNTGNSINKTADGLKETHFMFGLNQKYQIKKIDLLGSVLVDYVTNKDFVANKKLDYFLSTRVKYDF
ncbi:MAG: hypothetical protein ACD_73C00776G0001 [uncultured bacterium]|nr:MAG: hypothetical protein ACD_73C00776G0001 [uncultured bacterium]